MLSVGSHVDHRFAIRIEGDHTDVRPAARVARLVRRGMLPSPNLQRVPSGPDGVVIAGVALLRAGVADAGVAMIDVVPTQEFSSRGSGAALVAAVCSLTALFKTFLRTQHRLLSTSDGMARKCSHNGCQSLLCLLAKGWSRHDLQQFARWVFRNVILAHLQAIVSASISPAFPKNLV